MFGVGIHAGESSVCKAAIYDNSMPIPGGIIGVGIMPGIPDYGKGEKLNGLQPKAKSTSSKSFYTMKIDNFDMAEKHMRLIDYEGLPSYKGRVEFRN